MPAPVVGIVTQGGAAESAGIKVSDRIVSFNGATDPTWEAIKDESMISPEKEIPLIVDRGGKQIPLKITPAKEDIDGNMIGQIGLMPDVGVEPVEIGTIAPDSPAAASDLQAGDRVLAFNGQTVRNSQELSTQIKENKDQPIKLTVERNGTRHEIETAAKANESGVYMIGIGFSAANITTRVKVGLGGAVAYAFDTNMRIIRLTGKVFGQLFSGQRSVKDAGLAGPVGIVQIISKVVSEMGIAGLFGILGIISLNLGVFNLLPIPLLDGGQIMVLGIEKVMSWFGKTLSMAIREKIQIAGLGIILLLMAFTLFLDVSRFF